MRHRRNPATTKSIDLTWKSGSSIFVFSTLSVKSETDDAQKKLNSDLNKCAYFTNLVCVEIAQYLQLVEMPIKIKLSLDPNSTATTSKCTFDDAEGVYEIELQLDGSKVGDFTTLKAELLPELLDNLIFVFEDCQLLEDDELVTVDDLMFILVDAGIIKV